jgi:hypothetical protein
MSMRWSLAGLVIAAVLMLIWLLRPEPPHSESSLTNSQQSAAPAAGKGGATLPATHDPGEALARAAAETPDAEPAATAAAAEQSFIKGRVIVTTPGWTETVEMMAWAGSQDRATTVACGSDGSFRFALPDAAETAVFHLPSIYRIVQASGLGHTGDNNFRVDGARADVLLEVEVLPHVHFLVMLAENRQPVARASCNLLIWTAPDNTMMHGVQANAAGSVRVPASYLQGTFRLDFIVNRPPGGTSFYQAFDPEHLLSEPGPHEVLVRIGPLIAFYAHDALGQPVPGAYVRLGYENSAPAGADGRGSYRDAVPHAEVLNFFAPGHLETPITVPDPPPALLDVPMRRASTLTVRLTDWYPSITKAYRADLRLLREGPPSALGPREHTYGRVTHGQIRTGQWDGTGGPVAAEVELTFAEDGIAVVDGIYTDLPGEVVIHLAGIPLHTERITFGLEGVAREVVASALFEPRTATGRVVDDLGAPVPGTTVYFGSRSAHYLSCTTDAHGRFRFGPLPAEADVPFWTDPFGHLKANLVWKAGAPEADELLLVAPRARAVVLEVMRADGRPYVTEAGERDFDHWPQALLSNGELAEADTDDDQGENLPAHVWRFPKLPPGFVTFRIETPEGSAELLHDTSQPSATLILRLP